MIGDGVVSVYISFVVSCLLIPMNIYIIVKGYRSKLYLICMIAIILITNRFCISLGIYCDYLLASGRKNTVFVNSMGIVLVSIAFISFTLVHWIFAVRYWIISTDLMFLIKNVKYQYDAKFISKISTIIVVCVTIVASILYGLSSRILYSLNIWAWSFFVLWLIWFLIALVIIDGLLRIRSTVQNNNIEGLWLKGLWLHMFAFCFTSLSTFPLVICLFRYANSSTNINLKTVRYLYVFSQLTTAISNFLWIFIFNQLCEKAKTVTMYDTNTIKQLSSYSKSFYDVNSFIDNAHLVEPPEN